MKADEIEEAVAWRHDLHRHPELAFEEHRTAEFIARMLASFGLKVSTGLAAAMSGRGGAIIAPDLPPLA